MDRDSRSLQVIKDWNSEGYKNEGQKAAALQCLINSALDQQDRITRDLIIKRLREKEILDELKYNRINYHLALGIVLSAD